MCTRQDNFLLHLNLPCLMECKMPGLHDATLLSAPRIFALPNCFGPASFARRALSRFLSLSASRSAAALRSTSSILLRISSCSFLCFSSCCSLCFIRRQCSAAHLACCSTKSFACCDCTVSNHCTKSQRGGGDYVQQKLESEHNVRSQRKRVYVVVLP